ncbi:hypothetical protein GS399_08555 [Pedobacter sp. HMF7647]|uniref:Uncharacterized protein n=1 Tax=Hufsiella arboris TaxID=2695275 RepID=A0A7K1Y9J8_9SPHI|nr:hypothetical protein [Hufsiella arboris]MXV51021.1 hypothetical protein [Hufsiella arboris]
MDRQIITLCYRKIIDINSNGALEKMVFEDSYTEFKMQFQYFNQDNKHQTFAGLLHYNPGAEKLHFLVSGAVTAYVRQLNGKMPDILNTLGKQFLKFNAFRFELINSDIHDIKKHQVALNFYSESLIWHHTIGQQLLVSCTKQHSDAYHTEMFALQPFLSINTLKECHEEISSDIFK